MSEIDVTIESVTVSASISSATVTADVNLGVKGDDGDAGANVMTTLVYDPNGVASNAFDAGNLIGFIDGGTFH